MKVFSTIWKGIMKVTEVIIVIQLSLISLILLHQVVMRHVFNNPPIWSDELSLFLIVWVTFLGIGYGVNHRMHVRMTLVEGLLPPAGRKAVYIINNVICLAACVSVINASLSYFNRFSAATSPALRLPYGFVYIVLPVGFVLASMSFVVEIIKACRGDLPKI